MVLYFTSKRSTKLMFVHVYTDVNKYAARISILQADDVILHSTLHEVAGQRSTLTVWHCNSCSLKHLEIYTLLYSGKRE